MTIPTYDECVQMIKARGWVVHDEPGRLNILILRRVPGRLNAFDDMLVIFGHTAEGARVFFACRCTADPGKPSREKPRRRDGTAVWAIGQVLDGLMLGYHHPGTAGAYVCLVPAVPIPVLRFTSLEDQVGDPSTSTTTQIHRASATKDSEVVGTWSEGCVVVPNPDDYAEVIRLCQASKASGWKKFTVTCLERQAA